MARRASLAPSDPLDAVRPDTPWRSTITIPRTTRLLGAVLSAALVLASCESSTEPGDHVGIYELILVNGSPLPAVTVHDEHLTEETLDGWLRLADDNTFQAYFLIRRSADGVEEIVEETPSGTYVVSGNQITFTDEEGDTPGVLDGDRITVTVEDNDRGTAVMLVFEK